MGCRNDEDCARFADAKLCAPDGTCVGCEANADCESDACHPLARQCAAEEGVIYLDRSAETGECTRLSPCNDLRDALALVSPARFTIRIAPGGYSSGVAVGPGKLAIIADANAILTPGPAESQAMMLIRAGSDVLVQGLSLRGTNGSDGMSGILCDGGAAEPSTHLRLTGVRVSGTPGDGLDVRNCEVDIVVTTIKENGGLGLRSTQGRLDINRSRIAQNLEGAILASGTTLVFRNNFVGRNGLPSSGLGAGLLVDLSAGSRFEHNTLAKNDGTLQCVGALTLSNNILFGNTADPADQEGYGCRHRFSLVGSVAPEGPGNSDEVPIFVDPDSNDDFHLDPRSPGIDQGENSDTSDDIDGQLRPAGAAADIGADEVGPS